MAVIVSLLLAALTLVAVSLQKTYTHIPIKELKRRAQRGDSFALMLYRASAYGMSLQILLWILIGLCSAAFFVTLSRAVPVGLALVGSISLVWLGFAWLPNSQVNRTNAWLAAQITPTVAWALRYAHPVLDRITQAIERYRPISFHTGLYQKEDLLDLIEKQQVQADNRITEEELRITAHALTFGDKLIRDVMTPRRMIKSVAVTDVIGPFLMTELHDSGHSRFPVYKDKPDNIVGMLYLKDVVEAKAGGQVEDVMKKEVYYVHEEQNLYHALQAFLKTRHHLFLVINRFEELVGVISIEDVLEQILGKQIIDEFDQYHDLRAVAQLQAKEERPKLPGKVLE